MFVGIQRIQFTEEQNVENKNNFLIEIIQTGIKSEASYFQFITGQVMKLCGF